MGNDNWAIFSLNLILVAIPNSKNCGYKTVQP